MTEEGVFMAVKIRGERRQPAIETRIPPRIQKQKEVWTAE